MNATSNANRWAEDLAGTWTEPALEILRASGVKRITVDMELEIWRILSQILRSQLGSQQGFHLRSYLSPEDLKEQVLGQAASQAHQKFASGAQSGWGGASEAGTTMSP